MKTHTDVCIEVGVTTGYSCCGMGAAGIAASLQNQLLVWIPFTANLPIHTAIPQARGSPVPSTGNQSVQDSSVQSLCSTYMTGPESATVTLLCVTRDSGSHMLWSCLPWPWAFKKPPQANATGPSQMLVFNNRT